MLELREASRIPVHIIGGKASRLARMLAVGLPIPKGLLLSTAEVASILSGNTVSAEILYRILRFFGQKTVFVRSSAFGEDGELSWAGQFKTVGFVPIPDIEKAIRDCAEAQESAAVRAYAETHRVRIPKLALVIQESIEVSLSGVLFTCDPLSGEQITVIEAVEGTGDSLVSGKREPHRIYVDPESYTVANTEGASYPTLGTYHLNALTYIGIFLRHLFGKEQDIEWAIDRHTGVLYVLQCRDVTTVSRSAQSKISTGSTEKDIGREMQRLEDLGVLLQRDVFSDQNIAEILTPHPCQMAFGLFSHIFADGNGAIRTGRNEMGYEIGEELEQGFFRLIRGQPRCSIIHDACTYRIRGMPLDDYSKLIEYYICQIEKNHDLANYPELVLYEQDPSPELLSSLYGRDQGKRYYERYQEFLLGLQERAGLFDDAWLRDFITTWREDIENASHIDTLSFAQLSRRYMLVVDLLRTEGCRTFVNVARMGFFATAQLRTLLKSIYGDETDAYLSALTGGTSPEDNPNLALSTMLAGLRDWHIPIEDILDQFGHLGMCELEISTPRYRENPEALGQVAQLLVDDPNTVFLESQKNSLLFQEQLIRDAGSWAQEAIDTVAMARKFLALREKIKFEYLRGYEVLRNISLRLEHLLEWDENLIFHLNPKEVFVLAEYREYLRECAQDRHRKYNENRGSSVPTVFFSDRPLDLQRPKTMEATRTFPGKGLTRRVTKGTCVVIKDLSDTEAIAQLRSGSIVVTTNTDPAWSPILSIVGRYGGLVTEVGGFLGHGAIYAREVDLAAVANVHGAMEHLKTGMFIMVNGQDGYVEILGS